MNVRALIHGVMCWPGDAASVSNVQPTPSPRAAARSSASHPRSPMASRQVPCAGDAPGVPSTPTNLIFTTPLPRNESTFRHPHQPSVTFEDSNQLPGRCFVANRIQAALIDVR